MTFFEVAYHVNQVSLSNNSHVFMLRLYLHYVDRQQYKLTSDSYGRHDFCFGIVSVAASNVDVRSTVY